jgi:energy-coupling factor transporter ATP-binding protein EcfA2
MSIKKISYSEFETTPQFWEFKPCEFSQTNLVVGQNSTGKSRLINVINGFCNVLNGQQTKGFVSGSYIVDINLNEDLYQLCIEFANGVVKKETLDVNGTRLLTRNEDGSGSIHYAKENQSIDFQVSKSTIAIQQRQDDLQHPFVTAISKWALGVQTFRFGSSFGQDRLVGLTNLEQEIAQQDSALEHGDITSAYSKAFTKFGDPLDKAIINDMQQLGYELEDVGATDLRSHLPGLKMPEPMIGMFVKEKDRAALLPQTQMSQGMFRALALVIYINIAFFNKQKTLMLVDDIGEGLDYERSTKLLSLLIEHAEKSNLQLIMTSNDRFVMNAVPLENWCLLRRRGSTVRAYNIHNSKQAFADFKFMGLSNFDFFTSNTLE